MSKRKTQEEFIQKAHAVHGVGKYDYSQVVFTGSHCRIKIICSTHEVFEQQANQHLVGYGCPKCGKKKIGALKRKAAAEGFIAAATLAHAGKYTYTASSLADYENKHSKISIICPAHGLFEQKAHLHLRGSGCQKCNGELIAKRHLLTTAGFIKKAVTIHGVGLYDYSQASYLGAYREVEIRCQIHGVFRQRPTTHLKGSGCPKCGLNKLKGVPQRAWVDMSKGRAGTLYFLRVFNGSEEFYKVGVTFGSIAARFKPSSMNGYSYEILVQYKSDNALAVYEWEQSIIETFVHLRYWPKSSFGGETECFSSCEQILEIFPL